ncbi:MAG: hypothetical protein A2X86_08680 [Bdellovibrionales bacterium GWA2_49_15]|nr:MAG: hypothetical protein A2X86_08680 [Bdellovibrionales bacterium GWA2_49_15]HAZ11161.1 hypothetical protein [Bdellovibrionales bacterium]
MHAKQLFLLVMVCLAASALMAEDTSQIKSTFDQKGSSSMYFHRVLPFAFLAGKQNDVPYAAKPEATSTIIGVGLSAEIYANFSLGLSYQTGPSDSQKSETNRDEDIKDASGKAIRLVNRDITYEFNENKMLTYSLEYRIHVGGDVMIVPFMSYARTDGKVSATRFDMTDRVKPLLFSKHNRYTLTSENPYQKTVLSIGNRVFLKNHVFFEGRFLHERLNFNGASRNINTDGEAIAFSEQDFYFERASSQSTYTDNVMQLAVGVYF